MASFQKVIERSHSQVTSLKASVNNIFQAVSAKRFRDVAPDIRALVIQGIAHWTTSLPADFLQDQYLKYVAWALSDRVITTAVDSHALLTGRLYAMVCWACQVVEAQAVVMAHCHGILQQQMGWYPVQPETKDMDALCAALPHAAVQPPVPDASIIAYGKWSSPYCSVDWSPGDMADYIAFWWI